MSTCSLPFDVLLDYYEGRLDAATAEEIGTHLETGCTTCRETLSWLKQTLALLRPGEDLHVSPAVLAHARAFYRDRAPSFQGAPLPAPLIARLVFDSRHTSARAGMRGENQVAYRMLYSTEDYEVDLWQERLQGDRWYVIGQVFPKKAGDAVTPDTVVLTSAEGDMLAAVPDAGEFHVRSLPTGTYALRLRLSKTEILIPEVVIGP